MWCIAGISQWSDSIDSEKKHKLFIEVYIFFHWADIEFLENIFTQSKFNKSDMLCLFFD